VESNLEHQITAAAADTLVEPSAVTEEQFFSTTAAGKSASDLTHLDSPPKQFLDYDSNSVVSGGSMADRSSMSSILTRDKSMVSMKVNGVDYILPDDLQNILMNVQLHPTHELTILKKVSGGFHAPLIVSNVGDSLLD
jgi:hypothetical protein